MTTNDLNEDERFQEANDLIQIKYNEIEDKLINSFHAAFFRSDKKLMKKYLNILSNFKCYQTCINEFIKNSQLAISGSRDIFVDILPLCKATNETINQVFINNERTMEQFVKDLFLGRVQTYVNTNVEKYKETDLEKYLDTIYLYYNKNKKIFKELSELMKFSKENTFFAKLLTEVYQAHLKDYISLEKINLHTKFKAQLDRFYESIGHTKRNLQSGIVSNLFSKSNSDIIDERFLSHDVATLCIDDAKKSLTRISLLCDPVQHPKAVDDIYEITCHYLCKDHISYALELHINALQSVDTKQEITLHILSLIKQLNNLMYLYEQFTNTNILSAVIATPYHTKIKTKLKQICFDLEFKIDVGLEKAFVVICNHIKYVLQIEQKRTDFKSELDEISNQCTPACTRVLRIIEKQIAQINACLDGKNVENALKELGIKFHRCVYDHFFKFEYNELGAMALIRDINEYRSCAKNFNSPIVVILFRVLYSLSSLLVVKPGNLQKLCSEDSLSMLSKETIESFVQLRADYKTFKFQLVRAK
jgi:recyclin-1